ncbi:MAG: hypothetical protein P1U63_08555 [Coxiellaceae bacterium]|nr:hypothetical protein [Coxiellaceae bacterium]
MRLTSLFARLPKRLTFLTDVEGNMEFLQRWVDHSKLVSFDGLGQLQFNYPNSNFVFGGDAVDKGDGDLEVLKLLTDFKQAHPDNVDLIVGNRDLNKTRMKTELDPEHIRERLLGKGARWVANSSPLHAVHQQMITDQYLSKADHIDTTPYDTYQDYLAQKSTKACQVVYLKWMLNETMGCGSSAGKPETFELRRSELSRSKKFPATDDDIVDSYRGLVAPDGLMTLYLQLAKVGAIVEDTLFIHGAVTTDNMGQVPGQAPSSNAHEWVERLNAWFRDAFNQWLSSPPSLIAEPAIGPLHDYALCKQGDTRFNRQQVIMTNWFQGSKVASVPPDVKDFLNCSNIERVITGHKPCGDKPLVVCSDKDLTVIVGDTSYSDTTVKDNRGTAVSEIELTFDGSGSKACITGVDKKGQYFEIADDSKASSKDAAELSGRNSPAP